ncbi:MAG: phenylalanine--tRNA ligase subunit beta [Candidatus Omnitrophica bacterium]|nr:phenylalanine--tRNA ligase subunit beta [Candidatus Omnitrophota bacterium]
MKASLGWLKEYIKVNNSAETIAHKLTMGGLEVQKVIQVRESNDIVFDVEITSNRPDWLSHIGVAREIGGVLGKKIVYPNTVIKQKRITTERVSVSIIARKQCPFYTAVLLENVAFSETPQFIKDRLRAIGVRSINLPVDLTNYVLFEYGQPLHAFDFDAIGNKITVRTARNDEKFTAINEKEYKLSDTDLVISDEKGPIALAGVMGGLHSEVSGRTKNILLESAFFTPSSIRTTSRKYQLTSESSYRFERRVDPQCVVKASDRFISLFLKYASIGKVSKIISVGTCGAKRKTIRLPYDYINKMLGISISSQKVKTVLKNLELKIVKQTANEGVVEIPSFRADLERPIDLVEEIARIYGYDKIPETYPTVTLAKKECDQSLKLENIVRTHAVSLGMNEIITHSIIDPRFYQSLNGDIGNNALTIINPSNKEITVMRTSLIQGMLDVIKTNINHGNGNLKIFELGNVYHKTKKGDLPDEEKIVSFALSGESYNNWLDHSREVNFFDVKGAIEALLSALDVNNVTYEEKVFSFYVNGIVIRVNNNAIGHLGEVGKKSLEYFDIKQKVFYGEISLARLINTIRWERKFNDISKFPSSYRDVSIIIKESVKVGDVAKTIKENGNSIIRKLMLFDQYRGKQITKGNKSLTFSIEYQADNRTLDSEEVEKTHNRIIKALEAHHNATLRF